MFSVGKLAYDLSGRELDLGLLGLAEFAPAAFLVLLTGSVADRFPRRRVSSLGSLGEGVAALLMTAYVFTDPTAVGPLFGLAILLGSARAFVAPASRAMPADLVPAERLPWLVARWTIVFQLALVSGPVLAGVLYAVDPRLPFAAASALFVAAAVGYSLLPPPLTVAGPAEVGEVSSVSSVAAVTATGAVAEVGAETVGAPPGEGEPAGRGGLSEALEGLRLVRRQPILLGAISLDLFAVLFGGAVALLPAIADEQLGVGPVALGWLRAAPGIGAAAVMLVMAVRPVQRRVGRTLVGAVALFGLATMVLGATRNYVVAFVALLVLAGADALSVFIRVTLVPLVSPAAARGRVMAVENVFIGASNELGAFESGVTGQLLGPGPAVVLGGMATLVIAGLWGRLFPALRRVDRFPTPATTTAAPAGSGPGDRDATPA